MFSVIAASLLSFAPPPTAQSGQPPVVVELFTSQSCSSCPPAEAVLRDLASREGVVALEWHVDYWNDLSIGASGRWRDPFSRAAFTDRQRQYNLALRGKRSVYTPQMIINGATQTVGSRRKSVESLVANAEASPAGISSQRLDDQLTFTVDASKAEVYLVTFKNAAVTQVGGGENHGLELAERHIVTDHRKLGDATPGARFSAPAPEPGFGCALLVQSQNTGPIIGAAYCP